MQVMLKKLLKESDFLSIILAIANGKYNEFKEFKIEDQTALSYFFLITGVYFYHGLPKLSSDLSYITDTQKGYYIRNLLNFYEKFKFSKKFSFFSPSLLLYFMHIFVNQLSGNSLIFYLGMKSYFEDKLHFGYFKKSLLSFTINSMLDSFLLKSNIDFFAVNKYLINIIKHLEKNRKEFEETAKYILCKHIDNRKFFIKKIIDKERLNYELEDFLRKTNEFIDCADTLFEKKKIYDFYNEDVCRLIVKNIGEK